MHSKDPGTHSHAFSQLIDLLCRQSRLDYSNAIPYIEYIPMCIITYHIHISHWLFKN